MRKELKKLPSFAASLIGCVLAACFLAIALYYNAIAASKGNNIGQETGALVGKAIGSLEGITKGREEGTAAGKAEGLSAKDTKTIIANEIRKIENLEVLVASVKINDFHSIGQITISELKSSPAGQKLEQVMRTITTLQNSAYTLANNGDNARLNILKIGSVFQIFLIDKLASGKRFNELTKEDWSEIARQIHQYAILEDGQCYSDFVFSLYADYIDVSVEAIKPILQEEKLASIKAISSAIRENTQKLRKGELTEPTYIEECLWLSLEAMIKLLSASLTVGMNRDYAQLIQASSQLAFEYGRYVLYSREQELLNRYIKNQYALDEQLKVDYEAYLEEIQKQSDQFQKLVDHAFSDDFHETLIQSAELARAAGVKEEELLTSIDDIDDFFME